MTRATDERLTVLLASALACSILACGGHSIDLDRAGHDSSAAGASGGTNLSELRPSLPISNFWVDDTRVYWADLPESQLHSCVYDNCRATEISYRVTAYSPFLTLSEQHIFFTSVFNVNAGATTQESMLSRCSKQGCAAGAELFVKDGATRAAADANYLYWSSTFDIYRCPLTGCAEVPETVAKGHTSEGTLVVRDSHAYWFASDYPHPDSADPVKYLYRAPVDGSAPPTVLNPRQAAASRLDFDEPTLAVGENRVYWIQNATQIVSCPLAGCGDSSPVTLVSSDTEKEKLWVDSAGIYWLDSAFHGISGMSVPGEIRFCPLAGCPAGEEPRALTSKTVRRFQLDSRYVYWTVPEDISVDDWFGVERAIYRALKPTSGG